MNRLIDYNNFILTYEDQLNYYYKEKFIKEGLIYSVEYDFFIDKIKNFLSKTDLDFIVNLISKNRSDTVEVQIDFLDIKDKVKIYKELLQLTNNLGYSIASYIDISEDKHINYIKQPDFNDIKNIQALVLFFNKKFDQQLYINNTTKLYHVTTKDIYEEKISKRGLIPKHQDMVSNDFDRIYLSTSEDDCYFFMHEKRNFLIERNIIVNEWVILTIDIELIAGKINIYRDPKKKNAYYTYEPISPRLISVHKYINLK